MVVMINRKQIRAQPEAHSADLEAEFTEEEQQPGGEEIPKEIRIIAQEVKIVRLLASNDVNVRNRQVRKLRKWLQLRSRSSFPFTEDDFIRIWKGLYYNMWMSDKPLVQEELAEQLSQLLHCFDGDVKTSVNFFGAFVRTMCKEWFGIDQWRIDKFLMLTRRMLRSMFRVLKDAGWTLESVRCFNEHMQQTVLAKDSPATGLTMHFLDIFFEELAKVTEGNINAEQVGSFVRPFANYLGMQNDPKLVSHCRTRVFSHLLYQSELGREYTEKYNAWREMGFPTSSIHDLEKAENTSLNEENNVDGETETNEKQNHLDPRAGNVDVFMPELPLDAKYIIEELELLLYKHELKTKRRKMLKNQLEIFRTYQRGDFPLGVKTMPRFQQKCKKPLIKDKVEQLENLENEMYNTGRKLKQLNKRKRRKLLKSLNLENADESNFDQIITKAIPKFFKERKKARANAMGVWVEEAITEGVVPAKKKKIENESNQTTTTPTIKIMKSKSIENGMRKAESGERKKTFLKHKQIEDKTEEPAKKIKKVDITPSKAEKKLKKTATKASSDAEDSVTEEVAKKSEIPAKISKQESEWNTPLGEGEIEYFLPSRKLQLKKANSELVVNPLAKKPSTPLSASTELKGSPKTPGSVKRVKIALKHNTAQNPSEYIRQIKNSPNVPYDADKKPTKGLLKPNSVPSPINPFYKKKIGLRLLNDTL